ncbi:helix-turn-helix domain-containing protein [Nocardia sp. NPDC057227]|uniref:helix-turn-helix domain-containing protein n=1 Tax=Nocardia sp. NPDC057227 TaxID=3346056 RepID=UPI00363AD413
MDTEFAGDRLTSARLRMARESAELSLTDLSRRVPYSRSTLHAYESGRRTPTAEAIAWIERVCGPLVDVVTAAAILGRNDVDRRSFLRGAAYSTALSASAAMTPEGTYRLISVDDSRRVGAAEVTAVRQVTQALHVLDEVRGGGAGRTAAAEFLSTDVAAILRARFADARVRSTAFSAASELAYLCGFKAHDAGADGLAQRYYISALRLAEESGEPGQDGWALRALSTQGSDIGEPSAAPDLAEAALSRARGKISRAALGMFAVTASRTHAESGNHAAARATLPDPDATDDEYPVWMRAWTPGPTVVDQTAKTFEALGDPAEAERNRTRALTLWNRETHPRVHALTAIEAGLLRWQLGEFQAAADMVRPALPMLTAIDSDRTRRALARIHTTAPELAIAG